MVARKGPGGGVALDALLQRLQIRVVAMSPEAAAHARSAQLRFGKGIGSPAVLNFGDCLTYGVARDLAGPLLFKGDDFSRTDIPSVDY
jgi:ribonuclease VapC